MVEKVLDGNKASALFCGMQDTSIWSCLQNVMGEIYGVVSPLTGELVSAMAVQCDFIFFAGEPNKELVQYIVNKSEEHFCIMVPPSEQWEQMIEQSYPNQYKRVTRYAIRKEPDVFNRARLSEVVYSLSKEYQLHRLDVEGYRLCQQQEWSRSLVGSFADCKAFLHLGIGFYITKGDELVAGASTYSRYREGIEIEIDTREDYRRRGLAYVCGARLILECLDRCLYPSWDAQNMGSVRLAEKLGYHYDREYIAYEIYHYGEEEQR